MVDTAVTRDDILDSLTRQAASQVGFGEQQTRRLEVLDEIDEDTEQVETSISTETMSEIKHRANRRFGHYLVPIMGIAGMIIVWLYSSGRGIFSTTLLSNIFTRTGVQSVFANPLQIGVMLVIAVFMGGWVAVRRRSSRFQIAI